MFFWYRLTRVVLDKGPLNGLLCHCLKDGTFFYKKLVLLQNNNKTRNRKHRRAAAKPAACAPNAVNTREQGNEGGRVR